MTDYRFGNTVPPHERKAVYWYQPDVLWTSAKELLSSLDLLRNRDLRETYQQPLTVTDLSDRTDTLTFDFIADTGDGGNATYAVARAALSPNLVGKDKKPLLDATGEPLTAADLILFGGDLAYPGASDEEYRYRFIEMFEAARPQNDDGSVRGRRRFVAALAQNHDWMDSAATFNRHFIRDKESKQLLDAKIPQKQSYFCVKLPHGWWALGFDFALKHDLDHDQYVQFKALVSGIDPKIKKDDRVILMYPEPYWVRPIGDGAPVGRPKRYQRLEAELGERIALRLAGDLHHYLRWDAKDAKHGFLVTCGTGGAFTHPTHTKPTTRPIVMRRTEEQPSTKERWDTTPAFVQVGHGQTTGSDATSFERQGKRAFPPCKESRRLAWGNVLALFRSATPYGTGGYPWWQFWRPLTGNRGFVAVMAGLYWFAAYLNSVPFIESFWLDGFKPLWEFGLSWREFGEALLLWFKAMVFSPFAFIVNAAMAAACVLMGREVAGELAQRKRGSVSAFLWTTGVGIVHAALHVVAIFAIEFALQQAVGRLPCIGHPATGDASAAIMHAGLVGIGMLLVGGVVGTALFGLYLTVMSLCGYLTNNGFSALRIEDYKGFLRFRIDKTGKLWASFVALRTVPRSWTKSENVDEGFWVPDDGPNSYAPCIHDEFSMPAPIVAQEPVISVESHTAI